MTQTYLVPDMSCHHCTVAVTGELSRVAGVDAVVAAIDAAGYDAVAA